jgi:hypothetical protein
MHIHFEIITFTKFRRKSQKRMLSLKVQSELILVGITADQSIMGIKHQ